MSQEHKQLKETQSRQVDQLAAKLHTRSPGREDSMERLRQKTSQILSRRSFSSSSSDSEKDAMSTEDFIKRQVMKREAMLDDTHSKYFASQSNGKLHNQYADLFAELRGSPVRSTRMPSTQ